MRSAFAWWSNPPAAQAGARAAPHARKHRIRSSNAQKSGCWRCSHDFVRRILPISFEVVKPDLMNLFYKLHAGRMPIHCLNFRVITLLPKNADAARIQQYMPICLLNMSFKIFTKVLNNRILKVADKMIGPSQTDFIPGRYIMEGVVMLHETIHELHRKKTRWCDLKTRFLKSL